MIFVNLYYNNVKIFLYLAFFLYLSGVFWYTYYIFPQKEAAK